MTSCRIRARKLLFFASPFFSPVSRFIDAGYGVNVDAWRVARAAQEIAFTGQYSVSRFPGYPVQEIACSIFWKGGPWALNAFSAFFSAVAVGAFAVIARKLGCRAWVWAALAVAATPIVFVSSVSARDYIWALAFVLLSFACAIYARPTWAGIFLGLATGCRITSLAMLGPIALIVFAFSGSNSIRALIRFVALSIISAAVFFSPVWLRYGASFFTFYENHARPDGLTILNRGTLELWGAFGILALLLAIAGALTPCQFLVRPSEKLSSRNFCCVATAAILTVVIYVAAYLRLPDQAGYLLPIVPAILLLLLLFVPRPILQISCACLILAPFLEFNRAGFAPGAIFADREERLRVMTSIRNFLFFAEALPGHNAFVVGAWEPQIAVMTPQLLRGRNRYFYLMTASDVKSARDDGRPIFYLPAIREFNLRVNGLDLAQCGGQDLHAIYERMLSARTPP